MVRLTNPSSKKPITCGHPTQRPPQSSQPSPKTLLQQQLTCQPCRPIGGAIVVEAEEAADAAAEAETLPERQLQATPVRHKAAEAPDTLTCPPLQPVDCTGSLGKEPGRVQTATTAPGGTSRPPGQETTETSALLLLWIENLTRLTMTKSKMYLTSYMETRKYKYQN